MRKRILVPKDEGTTVELIGFYLAKEDRASIESSGKDLPEQGAGAM